MAPLLIAMQRRKLLAGSAGIIATGGLLTLATGESKARGKVTIAGLEVPNKDATVQNGIRSADLTVNGNYTIQMAKPPSRVVVRLEVKTPNGDFNQLDAMEPDTLSADMDKSYTLAGDLLGHPDIDETMLFAQERGESKQLDLTVRVRLTIRHNGTTVGRADASDDYTITATRQALSVEANISGSGSTELETETPTT